MLNNRMIALFDLRCYRKNGDDHTLVITVDITYRYPLILLFLVY